MQTDYIIDKFREAGFEISEAQAAQFFRYYGLLTEWNEKFNLTAITDFEEVVVKHFIDSCLGASLVENKAGTLCDIGTGAGFPGIPLKIMFPELQVLLVDSLNKRVVFLNEVIKELGLKDITAIHGRAEEITRKAEYREMYDTCVSRAVAALPSLSELCIPFVKKGGLFIAYKSQKAGEEFEASANALDTLGCSGELKNLSLFGADRTFVVCRKLRETPKKYPRAGGKPFSKPL